MRTFRAVAIDVFAVVVVPLDGIAEEFASGLYLFANLGQIGQFEGSAVPLDEVVDVYVIEQHFVVFEVESVLRKVKGLCDEIVVGILHFRQCPELVWR